MPKNKTEIDKELMYRKIMPSAVKPLHSTSAADSPEHPAPRMPLTSATSGIKPASASGIKLPESQNMILVNIMEDMVLSRLDTTLKRFNCCKCNKCKKDIAAIALNRLAPKYVVISDTDTAKRQQIEEQCSSEVTGALVQAILAVKKEPRH